MKKLSLFTLFLLIALSSRVDATEQAIHSTKGSSELCYEKQIEVQCYIVNRKQLADLFSKRIMTINQLPTKELIQHRIDIYFLVRIRNIGPMLASGVLHCFVPSCGFPYPIKVMQMSPKMDDYYDFVLRFDTGLLPREDLFPKVICKWDTLDTSL